MGALPYSTCDFQGILGIVSQLIDGGREIIKDLAGGPYGFTLEVASLF